MLEGSLPHQPTPRHPVTDATSPTSWANLTPERVFHGCRHGGRRPAGSVGKKRRRRSPLGPSTRAVFARVLSKCACDTRQQLASCLPPARHRSLQSQQSVRGSGFVVHFQQAGPAPFSAVQQVMSGRQALDVTRIDGGCAAEQPEHCRRSGSRSSSPGS